MTYELAKQLKENGFPTHPECGQCGYDGIAQHKPTLSELIEACGTKSGFILQWNEKPHEWFSTNYYDTLQGRGSTPEEAVANLWLKLNSKNG